MTDRITGRGKFYTIDQLLYILEKRNPCDIDIADVKYLKDRIDPYLDKDIYKSYDENMKLLNNYKKLLFIIKKQQSCLIR